MYIYKQLYVIKFVSHLRQVSGFLRVLWVSSTNKTEILLKVAINTIPLTYIYKQVITLYIYIAYMMPQ